MSDLREKRVELILQELEELPTLPGVVVRLLEVTGDEGSSAGDVVKLLASDPALTARILQLVHRAAAGVRGDVSSVERAVVLLGFEAVRSAALAVSVFAAFGGESRGGGHFSREAFWKHSIGVAVGAELLAKAAGGRIDPGQAFVCGLLHDLGKVALDVLLPKSFDRVVEAATLLRSDIADLERSIIGLDHMVVGKRLAERWKLPAAVREVMWLHGQRPGALPGAGGSPAGSLAHARLVNVVTLADVLVREQHIGFSGNFSDAIPRQELLEAVGVSAEQVERVREGLIEAIEPRAAALGLGDASSHELYQQALASANRELGRVSGQLAAKNRRLSVRAKFFDALSEFQGELRPDAPPQMVLQAIGQTAVGVLDVQGVGAFSLPPGQGWAEAMLFDGSGRRFEHSLIDKIIRPEPAGEGEGPVLAAGEELEWLLSAISPRLGHTRRYWVSLEADGVCVGGVVWGAPVGEAQRLSPQVQELNAVAAGWSLALRTAQVREEARQLAEQLAETNRQLHRVQNQITRSKAMISVGEMAAGAAHEMNNPLAIISGRSQLLAAQLSDPKQKHAATLIYEQSHRLSEIITEMMDFAKPEPPAPHEAEVAELIERALHVAKMQVELADRTIEVTMGELPRVCVDGRQVTASLMEVMENAIHATEAHGGHVSIHAAYEASSGQVVIQVSDDGCGMDEVAVKRAFDPFYSFRPAGRRRGMGLAKALRWIEASGGTMRLESRPKQGTRVMVLLPAVSAGAPQADVPTVGQRKMAT
jgi:signal transduction histidine kinase/HD-like signal output (HDOD) protein